jgi:sugar lactone lactonase YvrE
LRHTRSIIRVILCAILVGGAHRLPAQHLKLDTVYQSPEIINGVATDAAGTMYVVYPRMAGGPGVRLGRIRKGKTVEPYPNAAWNGLDGSSDPTKTFVRLNALRFGPDGLLWVVDTGAPTFSSPVQHGGIKLIVIDTKVDKVVRVYHLDSSIDSKSYIDDLRFHAGRAYITDAGSPGIIVLNLKSGSSYRVLNDQPSTTDQRPMIAEGTRMTKTDGSDVLIHADQLEVSPDGQYLYFQPSSGPLYRMETTYLDNPTLSDKERSSHAKLFAASPTTGGTAMDAAGNIYLSDVDTLRILKIDPSGRISTLLSDPRLLWVDAMWIDEHGDLIFPAAQLNRLAPFHGGKDAVRPPYFIYKLAIGAKPIR